MLHFPLLSEYQLARVWQFHELACAIAAVWFTSAAILWTVRAFWTVRAYFRRRSMRRAIIARIVTYD